MPIRNEKAHTGWRAPHSVSIERSTSQVKFSVPPSLAPVAFRAEVQKLAVAALQYVDRHSDVGPCNQLYASVPKGARRAALAKWFLAFGKVALNPAPAKKEEYPFVFDKAKRKSAPDLAGAETTPWHSGAITPSGASADKGAPGTEELVDLEAALAALIRRVTRPGVIVKQPELLPALEFLCNGPSAPGKLKQAWLCHNGSRPLQGGRVSPR